MLQGSFSDEKLRSTKYGENTFKTLLWQEEHCLNSYLFFLFGIQWISSSMYACFDTTISASYFVCWVCACVKKTILIFIAFIRKYLLKMKMIHHHLIKAFLPCSYMQTLFRFCREAKEMSEVMWFSLLIKGSRKGKCVSGENCVSAGDFAAKPNEPESHKVAGE